MPWGRRKFVMAPFYNMKGSIHTQNVCNCLQIIVSQTNNDKMVQCSTFNVCHSMFHGVAHAHIEIQNWYTTMPWNTCLKICALNIRTNSIVSMVHLCGLGNTSSTLVQVSTILLHYTGFLWDRVLYCYTHKIWRFFKFEIASGIGPETPATSILLQHNSQQKISW